MEKMSSFVSIKRILEFVSDKNKNAGYKEFRNMITKILGSYSNLTNILYSAKNLLTNLVLENELDFQSLNFKGEPLNAKKCAKCKIAFNKNMKEKILIFNCNHAFHKECIPNKNIGHKIEYDCPICTELEFNQYDNKDESSLIIKNNSIFQEKETGINNKLQVNVSLSASKTLKKLERYDDKDLEKHKLMINNSVVVLRDKFRKEFK